MNMEKNTSLIKIVHRIEIVYRKINSKDNKHMERHSTLYIIKEMRIKIVRKCFFHISNWCKCSLMLAGI